MARRKLSSSQTGGGASLSLPGGLRAPPERLLDASRIPWGVRACWTSSR